MLRWALIFLVIALIAGGLSFGGLAGATANVAQVLFFVFLLGAIIALIMHLARRA